jgi:hypothetical protein
MKKGYLSGAVIPAVILVTFTGGWGGGCHRPLETNERGC